MKNWRATAYNCPLPPPTVRAEPTRTAAYRLAVLKRLQDPFTTVDARVARRRRRARLPDSFCPATSSHRSVGAVTRSSWLRLCYALAPRSRLLEGFAYGSATARCIVRLGVPARRARGARSDRRDLKASCGSAIKTCASILTTGLFPGTGEVVSDRISTRVCCGVSSSSACGPRARRCHHRSLPY